MLSRDRAEGARIIDSVGRDNAAIIMDDGLQNPSLAKDFVVAIVDGLRGIGNGQVIPAGPLRAPLSRQLQQADIIILNAPTGTRAAPGVQQHLRLHSSKPIFLATTEAMEPIDWLHDRPVLAFAGIGSPERFFGLLRSLGAQVAQTRAFPDHHEFSGDEARQLLQMADNRGWQLVTTEKDQARMTGEAGDVAILHRRSRTLSIAFRLLEADQCYLETAIGRVLRDHAAAINNQKTE
jgi:tetraacyldisaccharide 4'-kinase